MVRYSDFYEDFAVAKQTKLDELGRPCNAPIGSIIEGAEDANGNLTSYYKSAHGWIDIGYIDRSCKKTTAKPKPVELEQTTVPEPVVIPEVIIKEEPKLELPDCSDCESWEDSPLSDDSEISLTDWCKPCGKGVGYMCLEKYKKTEKAKNINKNEPLCSSSLCSLCVPDDDDQDWVLVVKKNKKNNKNGKNKKQQKNSVTSEDIFNRSNNLRVSNPDMCSEFGVVENSFDAKRDAAEQLHRHKVRSNNSKRRHWRKTAIRHRIRLAKSAHQSGTRATRYLCSRKNADVIIPYMKEKRMIRDGRVCVGISTIQDFCAKLRLDVQSDTITTVGQFGHAVLDILRFGINQARARMSDAEWRFVNKAVDIFAAYRLLQSTNAVDKSAAIILALKAVVSEEFFLKNAERLVETIAEMMDPKRLEKIPNIDPDTGAIIPLVENSGEVQAGVARTLYDMMDKFDPNTNWIAPPTLAASVDVLMALMHLGFLKTTNPETGAVEDMFDLSWMKEWSCGILREKLMRVFANKFEAGHAIFTAAKLFLEVAAIYEETGVFDPAGWNTTKHAGLFTRYATLVGARPDAVDGNLGVGKAFASSIEYMDELSDLVDCFSRLTDKSKKAAETNMYAAHVEKLIDIREEMIAQGRANFSRIKPFTFMVAGTTSSMKSTVMTAVWKMAARANGISEDPTNCGTTNMSDQYHSEVRGQEVILIDDFMNETKDGMAPGVNPVRKLLDWSGNNPVQLIGAAIQDKGRRYAKFKIMGMSAYSKNFNAHTLSYQPNAAFRRIDMYIDVRIKPQYRDANGQPDRTKTEHMGIFPNIFEFDVYDYQISGHKGTFVLKKSNISNDQLLEEVKRRSQAHFKFQNKLVQGLNDTKAWACPHGSIPGACVQCRNAPTSKGGPNNPPDDPPDDADTVPPSNDDDFEGIGIAYSIFDEDRQYDPEKDIPLPKNQPGENARAYARRVMRRARKQELMRAKTQAKIDTIIDKTYDMDTEQKEAAVADGNTGGFPNPIAFVGGWAKDRVDDLVTSIADKAGHVVQGQVQEALRTATVTVKLETQSDEVIHNFNERFASDEIRDDPLFLPPDENIASDDSAMFTGVSRELMNMLEDADHVMAQDLRNELRNNPPLQWEATDPVEWHGDYPPEPRFPGSSDLYVVPRTNDVTRASWEMEHNISREEALANPRFIEGSADLASGLTPTERRAGLFSETMRSIGETYGPMLRNIVPTFTSRERYQWYSYGPFREPIIARTDNRRFKEQMEQAGFTDVPDDPATRLTPSYAHQRRPDVFNRTDARLSTELFRHRNYASTAKILWGSLFTIVMLMVPGPHNGWAWLRAWCGVYPAVVRSFVMTSAYNSYVRIALSIAWAVPWNFWDTRAWIAKTRALHNMWRDSNTRSQFYRASVVFSKSAIDYSAFALKTGALTLAELNTWSGKFRVLRSSAYKALPFAVTTTAAALNDAGTFAFIQGLNYIMCTSSIVSVGCVEFMHCVIRRELPSIRRISENLDASLLSAQAVVDGFKIPEIVDRTITGVSNWFASKVTPTETDFRAWLEERYPGMHPRQIARIVEGRDRESGKFAKEFLDRKTRSLYFLLVFGGIALVGKFLMELWKLYKFFCKPTVGTKESMLAEDYAVPGWFIGSSAYIHANVFGESVIAIDKAIQKAPPALKIKIAKWATRKYNARTHPHDWTGPAEDPHWAGYGIEFTQADFEKDVKRFAELCAEVLTKMNVTPKRTSWPSECQSAEEKLPVRMEGENKTSFVSISPETMIVDPALATMREEDIADSIKRNMLELTIVSDESTNSCHGLAIGNHDFLIPTHAIKHNSLVKAKPVGWIKSEGQFGPSFESRVSHELMVDVGGDYTLVRIPSTPQYRDIVHLFPAKAIQAPTINSYLMYIKDSKIQRSDLTSTPELGPPAMLTKGGIPYKEVEQYTNPKYPIPTFVGLCGAVWVTRASKHARLVIHSLHISGTAGMNVGGSVPMTSERLMRTRALLDKRCFQPVVTKPSWQKPGAVAPRHPINFMFDTAEHTGVVVSVSDSIPPHYKNTIKETVIAKGLRDRLGWPVTHKPVPQPNRPMHLNNALQQMTQLRDKFDRDVLAMAINDVSAKIWERISRFDLPDVVHPLPYVAAISGVDGIVAIDSMNANTSMGFPLGGKKSKYLIPSEPVAGITEPMEFTKEIMDEIKELDEKLQRGETGNFVFRASVKMEAIKSHKEFARIFTCANAQMGVLFRKYFLPIFRLLHMDALGCGNTLGINVHSLDWDNLARSFRYPHRMIAGDYKNFDQFLPPFLIQAAGEILVCLACEAEYSPSQITAMRTLVYEIAHPMVECAQTVFQLFLHVSGQHGTLVFNNLMNMILWRYVYYHQRPERELVNVPFDKRASYCVDESVCGDDHVLSVSPDVENFDQVVMREVLAGVGIEYTDDSKVKDFTNRFVHLEELTYLSRYFRKHPELNRYVAPLKMSSLQKSYCFVDLGGDLTEQQLLTINIVTNDFELVLHGKKTYERVAMSVRVECRKMGIDAPPYVSYEDRLVEFMKRHTVHTLGFDVQSDEFTLDYRGVDWHLRNVFFIDTMTNHHYYFVGLEAQRTFVPGPVMALLRSMISREKGYGYNCPYRLELDQGGCPVTVVGGGVIEFLPPTLAMLIGRVFFNKRQPWRVWDYTPLIEAEVADVDTAYYWASAAWPFPCELGYAQAGDYSAAARDEWFQIHRDRGPVQPRDLH